jgi:serine/threonine protein kinase/Tfp pilus assembly protein PilF
MPNQQSRAREIFNACRHAAMPGERAEIIERECGNDAALQSAVVRLVETDEANGSFLEKPLGILAPRDNATAPTVAFHAAEQPGSSIGPYKLLQQIGEGGFGVVYMAEQTKPVRRKVALKVIKPGMDTREVIARFEAERQALALMDHPNIAKVLDAGTTAGNPKSETRNPKETTKNPKSEIRNPKEIQSKKSKSQNRDDDNVLDIRDSNLELPSDFEFRDSNLTAGRPYFVMELVHGVPITEFCDANRLTTRERLELFVHVCRAVQHAHQKGVIHRDLKPSNVMVTMHDDKPVPKVIDFGVSKALSQPLTEKTLFTAYGQMVGTPLYMSPEQAQLSGLDVDTRSDVYSLGVLLYELLTGTTPFDKETLKNSGFDELRRMIRDVDPPRPSARISTLNAAAISTVSDLRRIDRRKLSQSLRGELDWIVMKALEKDRNRRYESASAMADDVERFLADEAVQARPASVGYRLRKFARRQRWLLITAVLVLFSLFAGLAMTAWQAVEASAARDDALEQRDLAAESKRRALASFEKAEKSLDSMLGLLEDPILAGTPALQPLRNKLLLNARELCDELIGLNPNNPKSYVRRADVNRQLNRFEAAIRDFEKAIEVDPHNDIAHDRFASLLCSADRETLRDMGRSEKHARIAVSLAPNVALNWSTLGWILQKSRRFQESLKAFGKALAHDPECVNALAGRAHVFWSMRQFPRALADIDKGISLWPEHGPLYRVRADILKAMGQFNEAFKYYELSEQRDRYSVELCVGRGDLFASLGRYSEAIRDYSRAIEVRTESWLCYKRRAHLYLRLRQYDKVLPDLKKAIELNPHDVSNVTWSGDSRLIARCPDDDFRRAYLQLVEKSIRLNPESTYVRNYKAAIVRAMERWDRIRSVPVKAQKPKSARAGSNRQSTRGKGV